MPCFSMVAMSASITEPRLHSSTNAASFGSRCGRDRRQRMLGRHGAERDAHDGVGARREHVHAAVADELAAGVVLMSCVNAKRTPTLLPIQLACIVFTRSGQPGILSRHARSSSA